MAKLVRKCPDCGHEELCNNRANMARAKLILEGLRASTMRQYCVNRECRKGFETRQFIWEMIPTPRAKVPTIRVRW